MTHEDYTILVISAVDHCDLRIRDFLNKFHICQIFKIAFACRCTALNALDALRCNVLPSGQFLRILLSRLSLYWCSCCLGHAHIQILHVTDFGLNCLKRANEHVNDVLLLIFTFFVTFLSQRTQLLVQDSFLFFNFLN